VPPARSKRYHHGDLKAALIDGAIELIAERGVRGFSLAELSRRAGVTVAAPYRHFADRDELLAAEGMLAAWVAELCPADHEGAEQLTDAIEATAHGYAALLTDQPESPDPAAINQAAAQAAGATLALIQGRAALRDGG
jgi:AcrR family transcriptional regulator